MVLYREGKTNTNINDSCLDFEVEEKTSVNEVEKQNNEDVFEADVIVDDDGNMFVSPLKEKWENIFVFGKE